jgi:hypothetical protein
MSVMRGGTDSQRMRRHVSVWGTRPLALSLNRVPERLSPLAALYSPSDRLALVKSDWSVGTGQRSST